MKIIKNYIYNSSYQLFLIILPIITLPYLSRTLGPTYLGINSYTYSVTNYFVLIAVLGTTIYAQREIAYLRNDLDKIPKVFWEIELLNLFSTLVSYSILCLLIVFSSKYQVFFWAYSITVIANVFDISWLFMGMENFSILAVRNFFVKSFSVALIFLFVKSKNDLIIYILINSLSVLASNLLLWPYLKKWKIFINFAELKELRPFRHLKGAVALFIPQISITLYTILNKVFLGYMGKIREGSYFDNTDKIVRLSFTILLSVSTVLMPVIAKEISEHHMKKVNNLLEKSLSFSICISLAIFVGTIGISDRFVPLFFGSQFNEIKLLLKVESFMLLPMSIANVIGNQYLVPSRKSKQLNISIFSGSIFNIVISIPLISSYGALGASLAIVFSESLVTIMQLIQVRKDLNFKKMNLSTWKYILASFIMWLFLYTEQKTFYGWSSIIIGVFFGAIVYFIVLAILRANILNFALEIVNKKIRR